ncbi:nucleolar protein 7 [Lacerta agilis]|uniref:nucleolar protein 7 n=1 Tax=Lacerta agilis TaxID=80427 RepID=UPI0014192253|nr:nucleolar protein 7 [Lacerta agilis]
MFTLPLNYDKTSQVPAPPGCFRVTGRRVSRKFEEWRKMVARRTRAMARKRVAAEGSAAAAAASSSSEEDEESGEAPEEVTFESARAAAEEAHRLAGERARREKATLKEKRRQKEELFKEQKKRKLLPENVLEELASSTETSKNQPSAMQEQGQNVEYDSESENGQKDIEEDSEEILATRLQESYKAVQLKDQDLTNKQQQVAKGFLQKHLYGRGCHRTTENQYFSVINKTSDVKKAAIQFVNKSWGEMEKQKAKKFTKHWVSSKISC